MQFHTGTDDEDEYMIYFSHVNLGAAVAVIWGQLSNEVSVVAKADLAKVKDELRIRQANWCLAMDLLKHILICVNLSWQLKKHAIHASLILWKAVFLTIARKNILTIPFICLAYMLRGRWRVGTGQ